MIDSGNIIFYPKFRFDLDQIKKIVMEEQYNTKNLDSSHHRLVESHPYLQELKNQFDFLSPLYNIYTLPGKKIISLHVDAQRKAALNFPIDNTEHSHTIFYEYQEDPVFVYDAENVYNLIKSQVKEIYRFSLTTPTLINNSIPHCVINYSDKDRVILSWSIDNRYTFNDIKKKLQ